MEALADEILSQVSGGNAEEIAEAKRRMQEMMEQPESLTPGEDYDVEDVFSALYPDYEENKKKWREKQEKKRKELIDRYD